MKNVLKSTLPPLRRPISGGTRQGDREVKYRYWRVGHSARAEYPLDFWIAVAGEYHGKPGYAYRSSEWEEAHWTQVYYLVDGEADFRYGEETVSAGPGSLLILPPGLPIRANSTKPLRFHWAALQGRHPNVLGPVPKLHELQIGLDEVLVEYFISMRETLILQRAGHVLNTIGSFYRILARVEALTGAFSAISFPLKPNYPEPVRNALDYLDEKLTEPFNAARTAEAAGVSASHLRALFDRWLGESPKKYHTRRRMNKARYLFRELQLSTAEVSLQMGFRDRSHFSKVFKKFTGMAPGKFRRSL